MEAFVEEFKKTQESKFEIIGKEHQILQLVLFPGESIETYSTSLIYMSPNLKKRNKSQSIKDSFLNFVSNTQGEVEYYNDTETIGYMGISRRIGKVIVINSSLISDIYFKPEHLLANSTGLSLDKKKKFLELGFRAWNKFKPSTDPKLKTPQIFLQTSNGLIEKELGSNEEIILSRSSIFAFSSKIKFTHPQLQFKHQTPSFIRAKGPGIHFI